jgi:hypothetical protein
MIKEKIHEINCDNDNDDLEEILIEQSIVVAPRITDQLFKSNLTFCSAD